MRTEAAPYRPWHSHRRRQQLTTGDVYELDVEIWPSCIVVPPGYRLALTVRGKGYEYKGELDEYGRSSTTPPVGREG